MAQGLIGALRVTLGIDAAEFTDGVKGAQRRVKDLQKSFDTWGKRISDVGKVASVAITLPFVALVRASIPAAKESRFAIAQVEAALKSMGDGAGRSAAQLQKAAKDMELHSLYDDDDILRKVTANMLTFGSVSGEVFDRAQRAAVNLSARLGQDLQGSTIQVGKALNDPIKGLTALRRVGIQFTEDQKTQIKALVASGHTMEAQKIILGELEREFGGAAKAMRDADPTGATQQAWRNFQETVGEIVLKALPPLTNFLTRILNLFDAMSPHAQAVAVAFAAIAAAVGPIAFVLGPIVSGMGALLPWLLQTGPAAAGAAEGVGTAGLAGALGALSEFLIPLVPVAAALYAIWVNWDKISPALANWASGFEQRLGETKKAMDDFQQKHQEVLMALSDPSIDQNNSGVKLLKGDFSDLMKTVHDVDAVLLDFQEFLGRLDSAIAAKAASMWQSFNTAWDNLTNKTHQMVLDVEQWLTGRLGSAMDAVRDKVRQVGDWFHDLYERVVGHSYIPDMVTEIGHHMSKLDALMVTPAKNATEAAKAAFEGMAQNVISILDRLYPDEARASQFKKDLADLNAMMAKLGFTTEQAADARERLYREFQADTGHKDEGISKDLLSFAQPKEEATTTIDDVVKENDDALSKMEGMTKMSTAEMAQAWADMASNAIGSLRGMVQSFKSGDILGGIQQIVDLIGGVLRGLTSMGVIKSPTGTAGWGGGGSAGFATGGEGMVGGSGGVDSQLIRLRATPGEMISVRRGDQMDRRAGPPIRFDLRGAVMTSDLLRQMEDMADDASQRGAVGGAGLAARNSARSRRSQL